MLLGSFGKVLVSKTVIGGITIRVGPKRLNPPIDAGLKLTARDTSARQTIYIYTKNQAEIENYQPVLAR
jgi:hypothetical protein